MSLELLSSAPAGNSAGYWAAREEAVAQLEAMAATARVEEELLDEQFQANSQIQEDEVTDMMAQSDNLTFIVFSPFVLVTVHR
jgi:hypothetical protein